MKTSLGLLEVSGLALAIGAADAMAKAASVSLIDIEKTNGSGWMLIRLTGDVASVQAAISTGAAFAQQHHGLVSSAVLARPADALMAHWQAPQRESIATAPTTLREPTHEVAAEICVPEKVEAAAEREETAAPPPVDTVTDKTSDVVIGEEPQDTHGEAPPALSVSCNLCLDPACRRHKGEPRFRCIHAAKRGKV
ncbi:BMC domain-containing protein [Hafnia paralvei]|uniref:BMC domain-containing protein n=1 Tax=Hafnia paralvei TaxID=546367 RepID=UPI003C2F8EB3